MQVKRSSDKENAKTATKRLPAEVRRRQLIEVAVELFARRGFEGTSTRAIAAEAGVSEAILYRHFRTKEELYQAILEFRVRRSDVEQWIRQIESLKQRKDDEGFLQLLYSSILKSYRQDPDFHRLMLFASLDGHPIARVQQQVFERPIYNRLCDYVRDRQRDGVFVDVDPDTLMLALIAAPVYFGMVKRLFRNDTLKRSDAAVVNDFVQLMLRAVRAHPAKPTAKKPHGLKR